MKSLTKISNTLKWIIIVIMLIVLTGTFIFNAPFILDVLLIGIQLGCIIAQGLIIKEML